LADESGEDGGLGGVGLDGENARHYVLNMKMTSTMATPVKTMSGVLSML
jgi:hypothetical protein